MTTNFNGKVAIITGGSRGIGRAYADALLKIGMKVCIADIREEVAKEYVRQLPESYQTRVMVTKCDVTSFDDLKGVFDKTLSSFGRIDMVINNAGFMNEGEWRKTIEVNVVGVIHGIKLAFEYMDKNKNGNGGHVISTASEASFISHFSYPVYAGTKHAVAGITKGYGDDYHFQKTGITVNAICPGATDTDFCRNFPANSLDPVEAKKLAATMSTIKPEVVADALLKILADEKNGSLLRIDSKGLRYVE